jgi:hypothetical protein
VRIWDVSPGYLNRQSLLGEHRELHGLHSILLNGKKGYARHPETLRWVGCLTGLARRHGVLVAEMRLRGYSDRSPVYAEPSRITWPEDFVTSPGGQFALLRSKYSGKPGGRIPLPRNAQELWAHHKYSVMARDPAVYRSIGRRVSRLRDGADFSALADDLVEILRVDPPRPRLLNALEHLWGYVARAASTEESTAARQSASALLKTTCELAWRLSEPYPLRSTALSDLAVHVFREHPGEHMHLQADDYRHDRGEGDAVPEHKAKDAALLSRLAGRGR